MNTANTAPVITRRTGKNLVARDGTGGNASITCRRLALRRAGGKFDPSDGAVGAGEEGGQAGLKNPEFLDEQVDLGLSKAAGAVHQVEARSVAVDEGQP